MPAADGALRLQTWYVQFSSTPASGKIHQYIFINIGSITTHILNILMINSVIKFDIH